MLKPLKSIKPNFKLRVVLPHIIPLLPALILTPNAQFSILLVQLLIGSHATNITVIHLIGGILSIEGVAFFERFMQGIICVDFE